MSLSGIVAALEGDAVMLSGAIGGAGNLMKTGTGNLTLSGSSSYTGATTVSAGRLSANGHLGDSSVAVLAAAELGGSGSIGGSVTVADGGMRQVDLPDW